MELSEIAGVLGVGVTEVNEQTVKQARGITEKQRDKLLVVVRVIREEEERGSSSFVIKRRVQEALVALKKADGIWENPISDTVCAPSLW